LVLPDFAPPPANGSNGKGGRFMGRADHHIAFIAQQIINPIRNCFTLRIIWKVRLKHLQWGTPPRATCILERADELFFLRIYAYYWQVRLGKRAAEAGDIAKLSIALGILTRTQPFAIAAQSNPFGLEQACHRGVPDAEFLLQFAGECRQCFPRPLQTGDWIARRCIFQQAV